MPNDVKMGSLLAICQCWFCSLLLGGCRRERHSQALLRHTSCGIIL